MARRRPNRASTHRMTTRSRRTYLDKLMGGRTTTDISDFEFWKRYVIKPVKPTKADKSLDVTKIDFNEESNRAKHHADEYDNDDLVVRRGQPFKITVSFDRKPDQKYDIVSIQLTTGRKPMENKGSLVTLALPETGANTTMTTDLYQWKVDKVKITDKDVSFDVTPPVTSIIGKYKLFIETKLKDSDKVSRFEVEDEDIYIIFNPWCPEDDVYMKNESWRNEYVMNESGMIWAGSSRSYRGRPWVFGQFDEPCLEAAMYLLDRAELKEGARRSIVSIVRVISAQTNSCDDDGVLEGRWTSDYPSDCTRPLAWNGSVRILEEFMKKGEPVRYGQCWVFSGVVTTLLRALGIPTRSVTNFSSAHDTDNSMTIDSHFDEDGEPIRDMDDSIWNFHVWNESWFRRRDLPDGYDGWQAHDATPQEVSDGVMRCGPASLKAIKNGDIHLNHDVRFIFSEVNGDRVFWKVSEDGSKMEAIEIDSSSVGKFISTKAVGSSEREDLTLHYKHKENDAEERKVVERVFKFSTRSHLKIYKQDMKMSLDIPDTLIGKDLNFSLIVKNTSSQTRTIEGRVSVSVSSYTGLSGQKIFGEFSRHTIKAKSDYSFKTHVRAMDYVSKLKPEASLVVYAYFKVGETAQTLVKKEPLTFIKPELQIKVNKEVKAKEYSDVRVYFFNPLPINLTNPDFNIEGAHVYVRAHPRLRKPIQPGKEAKVDIQIWPLKRGKNRELKATFSSDQLSGVDGECIINVV
ncbi:protein-glutamine gamma-glutamyltransferase K [Patella vulgata]|uniref:protein-glutamine gamma-glutamyltransferase K n=1 Tax=Patella vulgata TaxID=6465 RepID=UPI00217FC96A|nr:protein-glutamine gamma-glutamyltransferase K [Patella vulgata]